MGGEEDCGIFEGGLNRDNPHADDRNIQGVAELHRRQP